MEEQEEEEEESTNLKRKLADAERARERYVEAVKVHGESLSEPRHLQYIFPLSRYITARTVSLHIAQRKEDEVIVRPPSPVSTLRRRRVRQK